MEFAEHDGGALLVLPGKPGRNFGQQGIEGFKPGKAAEGQIYKRSYYKSV